MKTFYICSANCIMRKLDSQRIYNYLVANGLCFTKDISNVDLIIITTCACRTSEEDEAIEAIKYFLKYKPKSSKIIITGCLPKINPTHLSKIGNFNMISPKELDNFDNLINAKIKFKSIPHSNEINDEIQDLPFNYRIEINKFNELIKQFFNEFELNKSYFKRIIKRIFLEKNRILHKKNKEFCLVIGHGCLGNCSYCGIKFAVGRLKSRALNDIIREFKKELGKGYEFIYLIGEDVGAYGLDINTNFVELLKNILEIKGNYKIRVMDFNPLWLIKYYPNLKYIFAKNHSKFDSLTLGVQSGSNRILKLMNRSYNIDNLKKCLYDLKNKMPNLKVILHIIVGFPTETRCDFEKTKDFINEFGFTDLVVNGYSDRSNTLSYRIKGKIDKRVINRRVKELIKLRYKILKNQRELRRKDKHKNPNFIE